jgi:hypothetical protein
MLSVNLLKNDIGVEQARALVIILKEHPTLKSLCGNNGDETELDMSGKMKGAEDAIMFAAEIVDNGALSLLNLASNGICAEGTKLLAAALKGNQIMTELNISSNLMTYGSAWGDLSGVVALADVIPDMGAVSTVIVNTFPLPIQDIKCKTELDFSGKGLQVEDAIIIAALIPSNVSRTIFPRPCYH